MIISVYLQQPTTNANITLLFTSGAFILSKLSLLTSWTEYNQVIENYIRDYYNNKNNEDEIQILEAGCGQSWGLNLEDMPHKITGLDMDEVALEIRKNQLNDLHETIVGDLLTVKLESQTYDIIYCSYVLEHVAGAEQVMQNFVSWIKPKGLIIISIPDPYSVYGFMTRITPHWFHIFYYRFVLGKPKAGTHGHAPYPVHYDPIVSQKGIHTFSKNNKLDIIGEYGDGYVKPGKGLIKLSIQIFKIAINLLSLGTLSARHTNLLYILRSRP